MTACIDTMPVWAFFLILAIPTALAFEMGRLWEKAYQAFTRRGD